MCLISPKAFVGFQPTFSRHGIAQILSALALLIWLDEKVGLYPTFSRHGIAQILSALGERSATYAAVCLVHVCWPFFMPKTRMLLPLCVPKPVGWRVAGLTCPFPPFARAALPPSLSHEIADKKRFADNYAVRAGSRHPVVDVS
ncbi:MAG: hypothetical protein MR446_03905, partial [Bacteroidales bacterium]|nr:hypothetical protein [Bacteroidales bacterium]